MSQCQACHHWPSNRLQFLGVVTASNGSPSGEFRQCQCECHDAADAGPDLLAACKYVSPRLTDDQRHLAAILNVAVANVEK